MLNPYIISISESRGARVRGRWTAENAENRGLEVDEVPRVSAPYRRSTSNRKYNNNRIEFVRTVLHHTYPIPFTFMMAAPAFKRKEVFPVGATPLMRDRSPQVHPKVQQRLHLARTAR